jgi:hypothetical protein
LAILAATSCRWPLNKVRQIAAATVYAAGYKLVFATRVRVYR